MNRLTTTPRRIHVRIEPRHLFALLLVLAGETVVLGGHRLDGLTTVGFGEIGALSVPVAAAAAVLGSLAVLGGLILALTRRGWRIAGATFALVMLIGYGLVLAARGASLDVVGLLSQSLQMATPIALGALAGIICERSGVINIAIEGMMLIGACFGFVAAMFTGSSLVGVLAAILAGGMMAALHAAMAIIYRTDQIISGTAINVLAIGITGFVRRSVLVHSIHAAPRLLPILTIPLLNKLPIIGPVLFINQPIVLLGLILVIVVHVALFRTVWGLRTRACGEHPRAADTVGIRVNRLRALNVILGGFIAGLAGAWFSLETTGTFDDMMTNGKGFIALAAMIFGKWHSLGAFAGALIFGVADAIQIKLQVLGLDIPYQFLGMLPYIVTMVVLAGVVGRAVLLPPMENPILTTTDPASPANWQLPASIREATLKVAV